MINNLPNTPNSKADENLVQRLDALIVNSDLFEFFALVRDFATATADERHAVDDWCSSELAALDAQIYGNTGR